MKNRLSSVLKKLKPSRRKIIQLYCAVLFNANLKGFSSGTIYKGGTKKVCVPGLNCYSCPGAVGACPLGSLQGAISSGRSTLSYVCGILALYAVLFGRMICGWMCPFGLIQELLYKIKTPKIQKGPVTRALSYLKYVFLVVFVIVIPVMYAFRDTPFPGFCKYICPAGTLEGGIGLLSNKVNSGYFAMLGPIFTWKFLLLVSILTLCVFTFRMFCRFICPLGALYGFFNRISFFGIRLDASKCTHCTACVNHCKMDIQMPGDHECISCGECISVCRTKAISYKGPKLFTAPADAANADAAPDRAANADASSDYAANADASLDAQTTALRKKQRITQTISLIVLIAVLAAAILHYWRKADTAPDLPPNSGAEAGNQVGDHCYGLELPVIDASGMTGEVVDPSATGKITIINFWGTWCSGCVKELPYFDRIASEYPEDVSVIAVHTNMIYDTAYAFIESYYKDSKITFAVDAENEDYYTLLGGRGAYPMTLVLDSNGTVVHVYLESLTYEDLKSDVETLKIK